ncbi:unnamed protein product [Danaus chrysippus]|uniref:(African queen) hypothetical protein n=1 Tax=Danaus chrysippus TaxID=151541 RepID=A0A8J2MIQ3_9NEOP|nr:unnamed protein product [Danaus chrysippus]
MGSGGYFSVISARPRYMPRIDALVLPANGGRGGSPTTPPGPQKPLPTSSPASSSAETSVRERTGASGGGAGLGQIGGSEGVPKSTSPFSYPEVPSLTPINSAHTPHRAGWSMAYQSFRCLRVTFARALVTSTTN